MLNLICGFNKLTMVDFDGKMSATIFLGACNFRCPFCHNAELVVDVNSAERISFSEIYDYLKQRKSKDDITFSATECGLTDTTLWK